jgi:hypothetical protein
MKGLTTHLPNAKGRASPTSTIAAASTAPCVLLLLASHIVEPARNKIEVIIKHPALPSMVPPAAARMKKRKKAAAAAAPAAASNDASAATPTSSTAPATQKGKTTGEKKSAKPVDLHVMLMWAKVIFSVWKKKRVKVRSPSLSLDGRATLREVALLGNALCPDSPPRRRQQ